MLYLGELNGSRTHNYPDIRIEHYQGASESVPIKERKGVQVQINVCPRGQTNCLAPPPFLFVGNVRPQETKKLITFLHQGGQVLYIEGGQTFYVGGSSEKIDAHKANFLVSKASKLLQELEFKGARRALKF